MVKRFRWVFPVMIPVGAVVGLLVSAVITFLMPKVYESEVVIEVKLLRGQSSDPENQFATAVEEIKNREFHGKVVEHLKLANRWGVSQEAAIQRLKETVIVQRIRETDLFSIKVRGGEREGARDIATAIAKVYQDYRDDLFRRADEEIKVELNQRLKAQEDKMEKSRRTVAALARKKEPYRPPEEARKQDREDFINAKREFETERALWDALKLEQLNEQIRPRLSEESVVIHEEPQIADSPVSPNVTLNLILGAVGGFLLSPLMTLPVIDFLKRQGGEEGLAPADPG